MAKNQMCRQGHLSLPLLDKTEEVDIRKAESVGKIGNLSLHDLGCKIL